MKDNKKLMGVAAMAAAVGTGLLIKKAKESHKSSFEKFVDQVTEHLKS
jgi:hypothetical protein